MNLDRKWLFLPPLAALALVFGPMAMTPTAKAEPQAPTTAAEPAQKPALPRTPDLWQMVSATIGLVVLGGVGVVVARKLRRSADTRGTAVITLRQTLRLAPKSAVHAIEFDDRLLLIGQAEAGLVLLHQGALPSAAADEHTVLSRAFAGGALAADDDDEGATPKDLVIPRPANAPRRPLKAPATPARQAQVDLNSFRTLLQKAGKA